MEEKKVVIFGNTSKTVVLIEELIKMGIKPSLIVTLSKEALSKLKLGISDYFDIASYIKKLNHSINIYFAKSYSLTNHEDISFFENEYFDIGFVAGWQRLIPKDIIKNFSLGIYGMHGSAEGLPKGRGRSPMNWAIIEGRKLFYTSLFKYSEGVDDGMIVDTFIFSIKSNDNIEKLHYKNILAMSYLIKKHWNSIISGKVLFTQQQEKATYYPKRKPEDGMIDWERDIFYIDRFVRALTRPFPGAFTYYKGEKCIIWKTSIFETDEIDFGYRNVEAGTIVKVFPNGKFIVKCNGGLLFVEEYTCKLKVLELNKFYGKPAFVFPLNKYGYYDVDYDTFLKLNRR